MILKGIVSHYCPVSRVVFIDVFGSAVSVSYKNIGRFSAGTKVFFLYKHNAVLAVAIDTTA